MEKMVAILKKGYGPSSPISRNNLCIYPTTPSRISCKEDVSGVSKSGYYEWIDRLVSDQSKCKQKLIAQIKRIFIASKKKIWKF
ncbi:hypothetical protein ACFO3P_15060 [Oceanobacillus aidingensis]|uniref:Transposase n=1 Tax=Oceanobacillus aidingensis TaxID=645964 RepID=A0ABV9K0U0_9BACI